MKGYSIDAVFLNISKVCDSVNHRKLVYKLQCLGNNEPINAICFTKWRILFLSSIYKWRASRLIHRPVNVIYGIEKVIPESACYSSFLYDVKLFAEVPLNYNDLKLAFDNICEWCFDWIMNLYSTKWNVIQSPRRFASMKLHYK